MTPARWDKLDRVWHAVLARPEHQRAALVDELCAGDETLRRDVESQLTNLARASAAGFGTASDFAVGSESLVGRRLGPYAVQALLGVGGMGAVYRAHDSTLASVAINSCRGVAARAGPASAVRPRSRCWHRHHPNIGPITASTRATASARLSWSSSRGDACGGSAAALGLRSPPSLSSPT